MCPLLSAPSTASSSCLTPSPYLSGPFSFRLQIVPLCRISRSTASSPGQEFAVSFYSPKVKNAVLSDQINNQPIRPYTSSRQRAHEDRNRQPAEKRTLLGTSPVPAGLARGRGPRRIAGRCRVQGAARQRMHTL